MLEKNEELRLDNWLRTLRNANDTHPPYFVKVNTFRWLVKKLLEVNAECRQLKMFEKDKVDV